MDGEFLNAHKLQTSLILLHLGYEHTVKLHYCLLNLTYTLLNRFNFYSPESRLAQLICILQRGFRKLLPTRQYVQLHLVAKSLR
jgi:hypothetical protein